MIVGRSHPDNKTKKLKIDCEPGGGFVLLTCKEFERFVAGEPIWKLSGDAQGDFTITLKLERKGD
jgi:hypothetical protein